MVTMVFSTEPLDPAIAALRRRNLLDAQGGSRTAMVSPFSGKVSARIACLSKRFAWTKVSQGRASLPDSAYRGAPVTPRKH